MGKTSGMFGVMGRRMITHSCFVTGSGKMAMRCGVVGVDAKERLSTTKKISGTRLVPVKKSHENCSGSKVIREIFF